MDQTGHRESIQPILQRVLSGQRMTAEEAVTLLASDDMPALRQAAHAMRLRWHPTNIVTYIIDRNVSYTNVCVAFCSFCAFYRLPGADDAYVLPKEAIFQKIEEVLALGGTGILMQGGLNPYLKIEWYEDLLRSIKARYQIHLHCFSPTEIVHIAKVSKLSVREVIRRLKAAGLDSIPGGGGEILDDDVRMSINRRCTSEEWLGTMRIAHEEGLPTTATMVIGFGETLRQRVIHLQRIRDLQDETGGFTAFIVWTYQPDNTELGKHGWKKATAEEYLKLVAVARLFLDNIAHLQTSWLTMGYETAKEGLHYGADDFGSIIIEENVVTAAGIPHIYPSELKVRELIREAGFEPQQRDTLYRYVTNRQVANV
ncbi:MAG: cyclic dehypoxanthinyl futalosine synthase [Acidobacteriota bacterium]|nr:dehypoxanthine futalosine cyclase [Blastocatellia bacterium]MDW8240298.1 cyclic dehypoxanthinyl futalosine synthase [Acidobacteriota bacterium]